MKYRIGLPFWKQIYKLFGVTLSYRYDIFRSKETGLIYGCSPDIKGLNAEGKTVQEVIEAIESGAYVLVRLDLYGVDDEKDHPKISPNGIIIGAIS